MRQVLVVSALLCVHTTVLAADARAPRDEDVTFQSGSITIAGTLSLPAGRGPFPAVVLLSGSGPQNRDSEVFGFRPFRLMADFFVERGIAVLRCDDRGIGGSSGRVADATSEDFADDALAAVGILRARPEIDGARIGLLGHSEGAIVAAIAASRDPAVAFVVWMAGNAVPGGEILRMQGAALLRAAGATETVISDVLRRHADFMTAVAADAPDEHVMALGRTLVAAQMAAIPGSKTAAQGGTDAKVDKLVHQNLTMLRSRWMRFFVGFDPASALRRVACPVFAVFGGRDLQVPAAPNRDRLEAALEAGTNPDVTVQVYPDANHLFQQALTGQLAEYATLPKVFVPPLLNDIATWIAGRSLRGGDSQR